MTALRRGLRAGLSVAALLTFGLPAKSEAGEPIEIQVAFIDRVGLSASEIASAQYEVTRIYERVKISLVWVGADSATGYRRFVVYVVSQPFDKRHKANAGVLGMAPGTKDERGKRVWVFYDRIRDHASVTGVTRATLLGMVIAHEIGHLLLPYNSHTLTGLMSSGWDGRDLIRGEVGLLTFNASQAALIRTRLENVSAAAGP